MTPEDLQWNDRLMDDFPCWYNLKAEVVNFIQLDVEREDALKLATAEFDAPAAAVPPCPAIHRPVRPTGVVRPAPSSCREWP